MSEQRSKNKGKGLLIVLILIIIIILVVLYILNNRRAPLVYEAQETASELPLNDTLSICSFNIQFLGHFKKRDNVALASILAGYDIVVVQELVAPPIAGTYPNGNSYSVDEEAKGFLDAMIENGFSYVISEEDTGPGEEIHKKSSATEWFVAFYKEEAVDVATDLPHGFISEDRSQNPDYDRVPYAFAFRADDFPSTSFVLISVHLAPGAADADRRKHELNAIANWVEDNDETEDDFIILGDMNIEDADELVEVTPEGFISLNDECRRTNTLLNDDDNQGAKPYDHVMYRPVHSDDEIDHAFDMLVVNLVDVMKNFWSGEEEYPGDPYNHNTFKQYFSDHHPVVFRVICSN